MVIDEMHESKSGITTDLDGALNWDESKYYGKMTS